MTQDNDITPAILLKHMLNMQQTLHTEIQESRAESKRDFAFLNNKIDRNHALLSNQIDTIDKRLDDVEVVQIPGLKKAVRMR